MFSRRVSGDCDIGADQTGRLSEPSPSGIVSHPGDMKTCGSKTWKSYVSKRLVAAAILMNAVASGATAQTRSSTNPDPAPGFSFESARSFTEPFADFAAFSIFAAVSTWNYIMSNAPAAVLLAAIIAAFVAITSIRHQREMTRIRETFATINNDNWDKDVIAARKEFGKIKSELLQNGGSTAKYAEPNYEFSSEAVTLQTILNDYENLALGVRHNIIDEVYLFRWMRSSLLHDWGSLSPLVVAYRQKVGATAYIEFEGSASAWSNNKSYRTNRKLYMSRRKISVV